MHFRLKAIAFGSAWNSQQWEMIWKIEWSEVANPWNYWKKEGVEGRSSKIRYGFAMCTKVGQIASGTDPSISDATLLVRRETRLDCRECVCKLFERSIILLSFKGLAGSQDRVTGERRRPLIYRAIGGRNSIIPDICEYRFVGQYFKRKSRRQWKRGKNCSKQKKSKMKHRFQTSNAYLKMQSIGLCSPYN